jgi:hypothetical protein
MGNLCKEAGDSGLTKRTHIKGRPDVHCMFSQQNPAKTAAASTRAKITKCDIGLELVHAGLATTSIEHVVARKLKMEVARVRITETGRWALAGNRLIGGHV